MRTVAIAAVVVVGATALAACGGGSGKPAPPTSVVREHGVTVRLPSGWHAARRSLTPQLLDPREVLAAGTYALRYRPGQCAHMPSSALADLGPRDALVTLQERRTGSAASSEGFPSRPAHFAAPGRGRAERPECVPRPLTAYWIPMSDAGRRFYVLVAFGPRTGADVRRQAWAILDSLRVDRRPAVAR